MEGESVLCALLAESEDKGRGYSGRRLINQPTEIICNIPSLLVRLVVNHKITNPQHLIVAITVGTHLVGEFLGDLVAVSELVSNYNNSNRVNQTYPEDFSKRSRAPSVIFSLVSRIFWVSIFPPLNLVSTLSRAGNCQLIQ